MLINCLCPHGIRWNSHLSCSCVRAALCTLCVPSDFSGRAGSDMRACVLTCVWGVCTVHERKAGVDGLLTAQKENFSETESAFPSIKILLIHLGGLIIVSESGFISRTSCHLSD